MNGQPLIPLVDLGAGLPRQLPPKEEQSVATVQQSTGTELLVKKDIPQDAMQEIIGNAMKAVGAKRWMSSDPAQTNTVELWARIFRVHIQHGVNTPGE